MKDYSTDKIRNLCLAGQRGCGKTSVADAVAFVTGLNNRVGSVDTGSSFLDYTDMEMSRRTSITTKLMACPWKDIKFNFFDCPGHSDFIGELVSTAKVTDAVGFVINAPAKVEVGTQLQWKALTPFRITRFFFVNKMDMENIDWPATVTSIQTAFGQQAVPIQLPIGQGDSFKGIVDVVSAKAYEFGDDGKAKEIDIPDDMKDAAETARKNLLEVAAEANDSLTEKYLEDDTLSDADFLSGLSLGIQQGTMFPILFGSAAQNIGIVTLLDFVTSYLPSPDITSTFKAGKDDDGEVEEMSCDPNGQPMAYIFKMASEGHLGELAYFRLFSGSLSAGTELSNVQTGSTERATQIYTMQGKNRSDLSSVACGDIGVLAKLKDSHPTNTLVGGKMDLFVPPVEYPNPVMDVAVCAKSKGDDDKVASGLHKLNDEDPTFRLIADPALKQLVLWGQGSTHIEVLHEKLKTRFGVEIAMAKPRIPYRETIKGKCETKYRHKKQSGGRGQFGDVHIRLEPNTRSGGFEFIDAIKGGVIPSKFIPAVEKGIVEQMTNGGLAGSQVVDVKVTLFYGSYHEVDSSDMAFKIAGLMAFKQGFMEAKPVLLEPVYKVEVLVPSEYAGDVMGDMSSRRGKIVGMDPDGSYQRIRVTVPQAELYQYSVDLRSMTQGQGVYTMEFSHYEDVPHEAAQKVIDEAKALAEAND
ncbi:MAG: elongation factor G [candidate division Zixibacteria bacterium]|nr:elongation factor G [candidate division Zixibacteria bacterium]